MKEMIKQMNKNNALMENYNKMIKKIGKNVEELDSDVKEKLTEMDKKIEQINQNNTEATANENEQTNTKKSKNTGQQNKMKKTIMIVKPKDTNIKSMETVQKVKQTVDPTKLKVDRIRTVANGGMAIECMEGEIDKQAKETQEAMGDDYIIEVTEMRKPKIKIASMNEEHENIEDKLKKQNEWLNDDIKLIKQYKNSKRMFSAILEVGATNFKSMMERKKVIIGWERCMVYEESNVSMCMKCCGYNHKAKICRNKLACRNCGNEHKTIDCRTKKIECINCKIANEKLNLKLNTKHKATDNKCMIRKRKEEAERKKTQYEEQQRTKDKQNDNNNIIAKYFNIRGLTTNIEELKIISQIKKPKIIFLTETHLTDTIENNEINIKPYEIIR